MWLPWNSFSFSFWFFLLFVARYASGQEDELTLANIRVYANKIMPHGKATSVVMTIAKIPDYPIVLRLSSQSYLLAYLEIGNGSQFMPPKFLETTSISSELTRLQITSSKVIYESGYYAALMAVFWQVEDNILKLTGTVPSIPNLKKEYKIPFKLIKRKKCVPNMRITRCNNPDNPESILTIHSTKFHSSFVEKCNMKDPILSWSILNLAETHVYKSFPHESDHFTLKRYMLSMLAPNELWRNLFVIRIEGQHRIEYGARCYIKVIMGELEPIISGGANRDVGVSSEIIMDGSQSRDRSKHWKKIQFSTYNWSCSSKNDFSNPVCKYIISTAAKFTIPQNSFKLGCQYKFRLNVVSDYNRKLSAEAVQVINIVRDDPLHVTIICISNCAKNRYNPRNKVNLMASCLNCDSSNPNYEWYVGGVFSIRQKHLAVYIKSGSKMASVVLVVKLKNGRKGRVEKWLMKTESPSGGSCTVNPTKGIEATTKFMVCCKNYVTPDLPLEYFYYADRVLITQCEQCNCPSFLPANLDKIKVLICDNSYTCHTTFLAVSVKPMPKTPTEPGKVWKFITTPPNDVVSNAKHGSPMNFFQTIQSMASRITNVDGDKMLMKAFKDVRPFSLTSLGKMANLTLTFAINLTPIDPPEHRLLITAVAKMNQIFGYVYKNEMDKLLIEEPFVNITVACVSVLNMMRTLNKQIPRPPPMIYDKYRDAIKSETLQQPVIDKLAKEISRFDDAEARLRSMTWLRSMWQSERLHRYLKLARRLELEGEEIGVINEGVTLEIQCFDKIPEKEYITKTSDNMHTVFFSPQLFNECKQKKSNYICLKVISTVRELNWWYPEEKQPSSVILSVRIYHDPNDIRLMRHLYRSNIRFNTLIGKYKPAADRPDIQSIPAIPSIPAGGKVPPTVSAQPETPTKNLVEDVLEKESKSISFLRTKYALANLVDSGEFDHDDYAEDDELISNTGKYINCLENGSLNTMQQVRLYRANLDKYAMLKIRFILATHKLQLLLVVGDAPYELRRSLSDSDCFVPALTTNKTIFVRNNCRQQVRAYMAIQVYGGSEYKHESATPIPNGPAKFAFVFQERCCELWLYNLPKDKQHWSHDYCQPVMDQQDHNMMHCTCKVLGTYTSYVYHVPAITVTTDDYVVVSVNWSIVEAYILAFFIVIGWLIIIYVYYNEKYCKTVVCDMKGVENISHMSVHDILVFVKTGGRTNAETTASIRIIFQTVDRTEVQFTIMQDPQKPLLKKNSTYILWLRTRDIRIPTQLAVSHNNAGRYPSWYLRRIEVMDVQMQLLQVFIVQRWVHTKFLVLSSAMVLKPGDYNQSETWRERFIGELERQWINWGLWQPLTGEWRDSKAHKNLTRAQRCCVFASKLMVVYTICACYLGRSTRESVYEDRHHMLDTEDIIIMFLMSCIASNLIHYMFLQYIL